MVKVYCKHSPTAVVYSVLALLTTTWLPSVQHFPLQGQSQSAVYFEITVTNANPYAAKH